MGKESGVSEKKTFSCGEYVIYGSSGVCLVSGVTSLNLDNVPKDRQYYVLRPVNASRGVIYTPVDTAEVKIGKLLTKDEAMELIRQIPKTHPLTVANEKTLETAYKESLRSFDRTEWVKLIKCIYFRRQKRLQQGKKNTALDERYMQLVQDALYSELALVFDIPVDEVEGFIRGNLKKAAEE